MTEDRRRVLRQEIDKRTRQIERLHSVERRAREKRRRLQTENFDARQELRALGDKGE